LSGAGDDAVRLLIERGYPLSLEDYATYTWDRRRGGWKSVNFLIDRGICRNVQGYFELFASELAHPQPQFPSPEQVITTAQQAGGLLILAHPGALFYNGLDEAHLDRLMDMGVEGLECYSFHHTPAQTEAFLAYCRARNLLITGGSDCHGGFAGRAIGVPPVRTPDLNLGPLQAKIIT
jgi:hypothetical protein